MSRIIVTGGAGFLGSHLCEKLLDLGHAVLCVDNLHTGREANIRHLLDRAGFEFVRHDITLPLHPERMEADQIYNLACPASPPRYQADPIYTAETNVLGALNMLRLARSLGARILQAGTSEVYGDPAEHPQTESYRGNVSTSGIRACYDEGKRMAETLFFDFRRQHGVETKVARIFNTYGPRMDPGDGRVVSNFIVQALRGEDITVYGDGSQTRSFCYVDDLTEGLVRLMNSPPEFAGPVNLGNPAEFTVADLAGMVVALTGSRSGTIFLPLPQDDPARRRPDISLAKRVLDWAPAVGLEDGLKKTVAWFREELARGQ
ncbi:MAG: SDR family oxidoreductase [Gracilibacteraceae bacterium]|jgi:UDP-glucuronate decarboxylase|nr:SDR family oxidoreductase [Gracilibacteraceae bacterium]